MVDNAARGALGGKIVWEIQEIFESLATNSLQKGVRGNPKGVHVLNSKLDSSQEGYPGSLEQVNAMNGYNPRIMNDPYSNNYNPRSGKLLNTGAHGDKKAEKDGHKRDNQMEAIQEKEHTKEVVKSYVLPVPFPKRLLRIDELSAGTLGADVANNKDELNLIHTPASCCTDTGQKVKEVQKNSKLKEVVKKDLDVERQQAYYPRPFIESHLKSFY
ncbi:hypothetical protein LIER_36995 [Lithospermum erythrorhizon]|uniref:Uncharacterized protein n=1 Tax=Lithospermum erythrorhizon TaxID=34254 RepID=A0AAV3PFM5_LITER